MDIYQIAEHYRRQYENADKVGNLFGKTSDQINHLKHFVMENYEPRHKNAEKIAVEMTLKFK